MITGDYQYMLIETPDTSLVRIAGVGQYWPFALVRANKDEFLSWSGAWESFSGNPIIKPVCKVPGQTPCLDYSVLNYARWFVDSGNVYLIYGDSEAGPGVRRLLKLLPGGGPPIDTSPPAAPSGLSVE